MYRIIRRVLIILPAIALEALWIWLILSLARPLSGAINALLLVFSVIFVLFIVMKRDEDSYKILWLIVILCAPVPGALLYLLFGNRRTTRPLRRRLDANPLAVAQQSDCEVLSRLQKEEPRLAQTVSLLSRTTGFPVYRNVRTKYYRLGEEALGDMLSALEEARSFIFIEYFIIEPGFMWDSIVSILERKAEEGVKVRVLYDDLGSITTFSVVEEASRLWDKGIECVPFNPLVFVKGTVNYRDHRKMLIVDNRVAFSGGINLADEYINRKVKFGHWKDIAFRIEGPAVESFTRMFMQFWNAFARSRLDESCLSFHADGPKGDDGLVISWYDSPLSQHASSNGLYVELLGQAVERAWFYTPYLMPGEKLLDAFQRAAERGVDVRIIMPGIPDKKIIWRMSKSFYASLISSGVRIYEYGPGFVHAKASIIDDRICTIGTVNLDYRSLFLHFENNSLFYRASVMDDLVKDYEETLGQCTEIAMPPRGLLRWFIDGVLRIVAPLC